MSLITLGLRLVNLKGSLDKHLYTYTNGIYLLSFITAHAVDLLIPVKANGSNCKVCVGNANLLPLSLFWSKKKIAYGYSEERDLSRQARGWVVFPRRTEYSRSLPKV